jgi:hypothetical protein
MRRSAPNVIPRLIPRGKAGQIVAAICGLFEARALIIVTVILTFVSICVTGSGTSPNDSVAAWEAFQAARSGGDESE